MQPQTFDEWYRAEIRKNKERPDSERYLAKLNDSETYIFARAVWEAGRQSAFEEVKDAVALHSAIKNLICGSIKEAGDADSPR